MFQRGTAAQFVVDAPDPSLVLQRFVVSRPHALHVFGVLVQNNEKRFQSHFQRDNSIGWMNNRTRTLFRVFFARFSG